MIKVALCNDAQASQALADALGDGWSPAPPDVGVGAECGRLRVAQFLRSGGQARYLATFDSSDAPSSATPREALVSLRRELEGLSEFLSSLE